MSRIMHLFLIISSLTLFFIIWVLILKRKIDPKYSILWFAISIFFFLVSLFSDFITVSLAKVLGIAYPPAIIFVLSILFIIIMLLNFTVVISRFHRQNITIAQEIALLKKHLEDLIKEIDEKARKK